MLLNIYLATTAISWATYTGFSVAAMIELKKEGYIFDERYISDKDKRSFSEKLISFLSISFKMSIPVLNILTSAALLYNGSKTLETLKNEVIDKGLVFKPNKYLKDDDNEEISEVNENKENYEIEDEKQKKYDDMNVEEKKEYLRKIRQQLDYAHNLIEAEMNPNKEKTEIKPQKLKKKIN